MDRYVFKGMPPFIDVASRTLGIAGGLLPHHGRAKDIWHIKQLQDALGQLKPGQDPHYQRAVFEHINSVRTSLAIAMLACDEAIGEVCREFEIPLPDYLRAEDDAARRICFPDDPGVEQQLGIAENGRIEAAPRQAGGGKPRKG